MISAARSSRHASSTALSSTSASDAQKTLSRCPACSAMRFQRGGFDQLPGAVRRRGALGPHFTPRRLVASSSARSEEHTSELQSLMRISYAVYCLKKKITPSGTADVIDNITRYHNGMNKRQQCAYT